MRTPFELLAVAELKTVPKSAGAAVDAEVIVAVVVAVAVIVPVVAVVLSSTD